MLEFWFSFSTTESMEWYTRFDECAGGGGGFQQSLFLIVFELSLY